MRDRAGFLWRFIRFALPFFSAQHKWRNRGWLALTMALTAAQVAVQAGLNAWSARLYNAIEARHLEAFLEQIVTFVLLLLASIAVFSVSLYVRRRLIFACVSGSRKPRCRSGWPKEGTMSSA
jgi:putative ATP-binding cassette transporter